jgi:Helix-turn-helix domain
MREGVMIEVIDEIAANQTIEIRRAQARIRELVRLTEILARCASEVGQRLRIARMRLCISEQEAAAAAKVTVKTWRKYEAGGGGYCTITVVNFALAYRWTGCSTAMGTRRHAAGRGSS